MGWNVGVGLVVARSCRRVDHITTRRLLNCVSGAHHIGLTVATNDAPGNVCRCLAALIGNGP